MDISDPPWAQANFPPPLGWCTGVSLLIVATVRMRCARGATTPSWGGTDILWGGGGGYNTPFRRRPGCVLPLPLRMRCCPSPSQAVVPGVLRPRTFACVCAPAPWPPSPLPPGAPPNAPPKRPSVPRPPGRKPQRAPPPSARGAPRPRRRVRSSSRAFWRALPSTRSSPQYSRAGAASAASRSSRFSRGNGTRLSSGAVSGSTSTHWRRSSPTASLSRSSATPPGAGWRGCTSA